MTDQLPVLIIIIPLLAAIITPLLGWWRENLCYPWVILSLALCMVCSIFVLDSVIDTGAVHYYMGSWLPPWGIEYVIDHLNALMLIIISATALIVAVYSKRNIVQEIDGSIVYFYTVFLLQVTGFLGIVITGDMFNLYVFLEITSLTGYALIAAGEDGAPLASFRYIIMGTVGACFYLLGVGYLYIATGSLNIADLARLLPDLYGSKVILVAFAFFFVGIAIKMALFPLHTWLPDAYTKAPSAASALIAPLMTKVSVYVMLRIMYTVFKPSLSMDTLPVTDIMIWLGIAAIVAGAVMALAQTDFKRMCCYIVVAEIGYMVGGTGLANAMAVKGVILHILNDAIMTLGMFVIAGIFYYQTQGHTLTDFKDLFKKMPYTMAAFVVTALSIIGVPPTCGFFSKWYLIQGAIIAHCWAFVAALLLSSLINIILFFRIFEIGYGFSETHGHEHDVLISEAPMSMLIPTIITAVGIILIGIYNQPIINHVIQFAVPKL
ncbi:MAG: monovalent cation/H+ antiporter subunit D family protein [Thermodesulfobacteriota bacterium]|nr:monovalent cation/H+ antiporter subunit D family protein [Thermodesulfobacteriota bacterium]